MSVRHLDLTGPLRPGIWSYRPIVPDAPDFEQWRWATVEERGWEADAFTMSTLTGTYLETAKHLFPDQYAIDELDPARCFVDAVVIPLPKQDREHITVADLAAAAPDLRPGDAALIATGWDIWWDDADRFVRGSPHFERDAMSWLIERGVSIVGGDMSCFDDPDPDGAQAVNHVLFGADALILAPLVNLTQAPAGRSRLTVLPIKLQGACGAPCRAILTIDA